MPIYLQFDPKDDGALWIKSTKPDAHLRLDGKPNYPTKHDSSDPLHQFLDQLDPATVAKLYDGSVVFLNPHNSRTAPSFNAIRMILKHNRIKMEKSKIKG